MAYFNTTTPQLRFIERVFEAYRTRDLNNLALLYSRDFSYRWLPKAAEFPDETREGHIESLGPLFAKLAKVDHIIHEVIETPGKVVIHWTVSFTSQDGAEFDYDSLAVFTLVKEDGELKLLEIKDFGDPNKRSYFFKFMTQERQIA